MSSSSRPSSPLLPARVRKVSLSRPATPTIAAITQQLDALDGDTTSLSLTPPTSSFFMKRSGAGHQLPLPSSPTSMAMALALSDPRPLPSIASQTTPDLSSRSPSLDSTPTMDPPAFSLPPPPRRRRSMSSHSNGQAASAASAGTVTGGESNRNAGIWSADSVMLSGADHLTNLSRSQLHVHLEEPMEDMAENFDAIPISGTLGLGLRHSALGRPSLPMLSTPRHSIEDFKQMHSVRRQQSCSSMVSSSSASSSASGNSEIFASAPSSPDRLTAELSSDGSFGSSLNHLVPTQSQRSGQRAISFSLGLADKVPRRSTAVVMMGDNPSVDGSQPLGRKSTEMVSRRSSPRASFDCIGDSSNLTHFVATPRPSLDRRTSSRCSVELTRQQQQSVIVAQALHPGRSNSRISVTQATYPTLENGSNSPTPLGTPTEKQPRSPQFFNSWTPMQNKDRDSLGGGVSPTPGLGNRIRNRGLRKRWASISFIRDSSDRGNHSAPEQDLYYPSDGTDTDRSFLSRRGPSLAEAMETQYTTYHQPQKRFDPSQLPRFNIEPPRQRPETALGFGADDVAEQLETNDDGDEPDGADSPGDRDRGKWRGRASLNLSRLSIGVRPRMSNLGERDPSLPRNNRRALSLSEAKMAMTRSMEDLRGAGLKLNQADAAARARNPRDRWSLFRRTK